MALSNYERVKRWRAKNKDKVAAQNRRRLVRSKEHIRAQQAAWRSRNIERVRKMDAANRKRQRRQNPEAQRARKAAFKARALAKQEAVAGRPRPDACELCARSDGGHIVFDHCHVHGHFRGWICDRCNKTLGLVRDNPVLLRSMADYVERSNAKTFRKAA